MWISAAAAKTHNNGGQQPRRHEHILGGVTRNICENLARLGGSVKSLISALGSDLYGHMIREESTAAIDMSQCMTVEGHPSSTYMSLLDERGEMYGAIRYVGAPTHGYGVYKAQGKA